MDQECAVDTAFKECASCETTWLERRDFLEDPDIKVVGYQVHFEDLQTGLFLFNHHCGNTLALHAAQFTDLYKGPVFKVCKQNTDECPDYCLHEDELRPCPVRCECAFVRETLRIVNHWPKQEEQAA